jgi:FAD/FMN-containing dehydrogenase
MNRGHGSTASINRLYNGIEIWLNQLDSIEIQEAGDTAVVGGGVTAKRMMDTLWAAKKETGRFFLICPFYLRTTD